MLAVAPLECGVIPTILEYGDREILRGIGGEPEAEVEMSVIWNDDLLTDLLQPRHP